RSAGAMPRVTYLPTPCSTAIATGCFPKTSTRRPACCGAISRRLIRWPASFSRRCGCRAAGKIATGAAEGSTLGQLELDAAIATVGVLPRPTFDPLEFTEPSDYEPGWC